MRHKNDDASSEAEDSGEDTDVEDYPESEWDELDDQYFADSLKWQWWTFGTIWIEFLPNCVVNGGL